MQMVSCKCARTKHVDVKAQQSFNSGDLVESFNILYFKWDGSC